MTGQWWWRNLSHESPSMAIVHSSLRGLWKDFNACGADRTDRRVIPANTKRKSHVYLDLRVGGRLMRREGSCVERLHTGQHPQRRGTNCSNKDRSAKHAQTDREDKFSVSKGGGVVDMNKKKCAPSWSAVPNVRTTSVGPIIVNFPVVRRRPRNIFPEGLLMTAGAGSISVRRSRWPSVPRRIEKMSDELWPNSKDAPWSGDYFLEVSQASTFWSQ